MEDQEAGLAGMEDQEVVQAWHQTTPAQDTISVEVADYFLHRSMKIQEK